jgi:Protein of unknown function (DUF3096)
MQPRFDFPRERDQQKWNPVLRPIALSDIKRAHDLVAKPLTLGGSCASHSGDISMTITTAHIPAIVALIAGILILIMPRLLNLVVAIYLICIGLIGLGVLKWLHM